MEPCREDVLRFKIKSAPQPAWAEPDWSMLTWLWRLSGFQFLPYSPDLWLRGTLWNSDPWIDSCLVRGLHPQGPSVSEPWLPSDLSTEGSVPLICATYPLWPLSQQNPQGVCSSLPAPGAPAGGRFFHWGHLQVGLFSASSEQLERISLQWSLRG